MTYSHRFPRFIEWLTLHDNFMHTSVSFSACCHIWASKLCLVSSYWLLILVANLYSSASACTLKSGELHPLLMRASLVLCDGHFVLIKKQGSRSCFPEACYAIWEPGKGYTTCPGLKVMIAHTPARICTLSSSTYPSEPQLSQLMHQHHILNMVSLLFYKQTIQHSTVGWLCVVRWLYLCACCSCMCTSRSFSQWKPKKLVITQDKAEPWKCWE